MAQNKIPCFSHENQQEIFEKDPSQKVRYEELENYITDYTRLHPHGESTRAPRIIPVVVHVLHQYGSENISKEQILDQIRILNEDFQRLNEDTTDTPAAFQSLAANTNIEFRLAQLDPNGNCTDGIVRVYTPLTNGVNPRDQLKAVSYWNSTKYLNIWVVREIFNANNTPGTILGYAQFPNSGSAATDGIVLRSDVIGALGSDPFANKGRTATHEIGHWLNLRHIWGDQDCGNDQVSDTPTHQTSNAGCPQFPHNVNSSCNPGPNGEMYTNYMDYTNGVCQNMFSKGQKTRMDAVFNSSRATLVSANNLAATGVDGNGPVSCTPIADFTPFQYRTICEGATISYSDVSWGGEVVSRRWSFPGGIADNDTAKNVNVTYTTAGAYDISLMVKNNTDSSTKTLNGRIIVLPNTADKSVPYKMDFEDLNTFNSEIKLLNQENDAKSWNRTTATGYQSSACAKMDNLGLKAGFKDALVLPSIDLAGATNVQVSFKYSYKLKSTSSDDRLQFFVSNNCGQTWNPRWTGTPSGMAYTTSTQTSAFTPADSTMWKSQTITIPSTYCKANTLFKFDFTSGDGNNLYIDDINITAGGVGINEALLENPNLTLQPNPATNGISRLSFNSGSSGKQIKVTVSNVLGQELLLIYEGKSTGTVMEMDINYSNFLPTGLYVVKVSINGNTHSKKLLVR